MVCLNTTRNHARSFNVYEVPEWVLQYQNIWDKVKSQLCDTDNRGYERKKQIHAWQAENLKKTH